MPVIASNKLSLGPQSNTLFTSLPEGFIYLAEICPTILQDIKYASDDNFTGNIVEGYNKAVAILIKDAATMLQNAQQELEQQGLSFLIWDAYRPIRAVNFFLKWRDVKDDPNIKAKYYPDFNKEEIFFNGFIAPGKSSHSRGSTIDLTIIDKKTNIPLDMGTDFDFFGTKSYTESNLIIPKAQENRKLLKNLMEKHGFENLPQEWWHYTLKREPFPDKYFDFPIK